MKKHNDKDIEEIYLELISPKVFREKFESENKFKEYLYFRNLDELNMLMSKFVKQQDYENCCIIRDAINDKKLNKLMK